MLVTFDFYTRQYMKYFFGRDYSARASSNSLGPIKSFIYSVEMREDHACLLGGTYSWTISRSDAGDKISGGIYGITAQRHPEPDGTYTYQPACPGLTADLVVEVFGAPDATRGMALRLTGSPRRSGSRELIYRSKTARARFSLDQVGHIINVSVGNSSAQ